MLLASWMVLAHLAPAEENFGPEFAALKTQYDLRVKSDVQQVFDAAIADLNAKYTATLDRSLYAAQKAGRLDDAIALRTEVEAIAQGKGVHATDDGKTPATLKQMREVYRTSAGRIALDRAKRLQPLQTTFAKSLDAVVTHLTSAGKLDEAAALRKYRDALTAPVPPPIAVGAASGSPGGVGDAAKDSVVTREVLVAKPWKYRLDADTRTWTFNADKTLTSSSGNKATWSIRGKTLHLEWENGGGTNEYSLVLQPSAGELILNGVDGSGKPNGMTMTQIEK